MAGVVAAAKFDEAVVTAEPPTDGSDVVVGRTGIGTDTHVVGSNSGSNDPA